MKIAVAADHAGMPLREGVIEAVRAAGHEALDLGVFNPEPVDYPDVTERAGRAILTGEATRAIVLCGSGVGAAIAANKMSGIYAGVCHDTYSAHQGVEHDNMNMLCLGARVVGPELMGELVVAFLGARFLGHDPGQERHLRRVGKITDLEKRDR
jgi:ribose 5-phosphate isomerase B